MLFTFFGVNIESVTLIVIIFMFGLGVGAIIGGFVSKIFQNHLPIIFLYVETVSYTHLTLPTKA